MREIVVRSLTSGDCLNRDCRVTEVMQQAGCLTTVMRRCTYRIASRITVPSIDDSIRWAKTLDPQMPRQVYVTKDLDPETGCERITYKVLGHLYVVLGRDVFGINYRHVLSMVVEGSETFCDS